MKLFHTALVLGKGGFGTQLGEMLAEAGGYSRILYLDDQAPDAAGKLADYLDPAIRERCTAAFVGLGNNELRLQWLQKLVAAGHLKYYDRNFVAPRLTELKGAGVLEVVGKKPSKRTGKNTAVWAAVRR